MRRTVSDPRFYRHRNEPNVVIRMHLEKNRWSTPGQRGTLRNAVEEDVAHRDSTWKALYEELKRARGVKVERKWRDETLIPWSVVTVELIITLVFVGFFTISFWYGTWTLIDLSFATFFPGTRCVVYVKRSMCVWCWRELSNRCIF